MLKHAILTCTSITQLISVSPATPNVKLAVAFLSVLLVLTLKLFQSTESVTIALILAIHAATLLLPVPPVLKDSILLELLVLLLVLLELILKMEYVFAEQATSSPTNVFQTAPLDTEMLEVNARNVLITVLDVMEQKLPALVV